MLEYGQPMHCFDYKYVNGGHITVRNAKPGEEIETLDGANRTLGEEMLVIADEKGPIAVAGVMGGEFSGVYDDTTTIVFESAMFNGPSVRTTAKKLGMRTEASGRYEKGLDPNGCRRCLDRALELVQLLDAGDVVVGSDIEHLSDDELAKLAQRTTLFARLTPMHKERIVTLLKREGHVVGFMGDGINDAPALRAADIGISVDGAVDIAREAADIILLEKSLMVLEEGVIEGRRTFANMLKYIKMTASSNFGNVFSVLVASAFLPFLPMLPLHLLIQNLMYDVSQVAIPFDNVDDEQIQKPQHWNPADLGRFMLFFGPISSIFDILTFCLMWFVFHANTPEHQTLFQSGWFVVGLLSQTLIVHMIRTRRIPFIQSRAAWPLIVMTGIVMALGIALPFSPLAGYLQLQALPLSYFPWLVAILAGYMVLTQMVKGFYARRYGWQ